MYIPWNVHEPSPGTFDFSLGLDVVSFIKKAQEQNLLVIVRPAPYICAGKRHLLPPDSHSSITSNKNLSSEAFLAGC